MGGQSTPSSNQSFSSGRGKSSNRGSRGRFQPHQRPLFFQKRLENKKMLKQHDKHYYQWLRSTIHHKTKINQSTPYSLKIQGPSKRSSSGLLYPVSSVKECYRKGENVKSLGFHKSPVSSLQASPKAEASDSHKQAQHLPTSRKVQNGNTIRASLISG